MKTTITILMLCVCTTITGQLKTNPPTQPYKQPVLKESEEVKLFVSELVMTTDAYIDRGESEKKYEGILFNYVMIVPNTTKFYLLKLEVDQILRKHENIKILEPWTKDKDRDNVFRILMNIDNRLVSIAFVEYNYLMIMDKGLIK